MKRYLLILLTIFLTVNVDAEGIKDDNLNKQIKLLQSQQVDTILIHKYALFTGMFHIRTDNKELFCEGIPYVYHVFWKKNGRTFCKRLDDCGEFMDVPVQIKNIEAVVAALSSAQIEFKKQSAHFTVYQITVILKDSKNEIRVSGSQMKNDKSNAIKKIELLNEKIKNLEAEGLFKRS